MATLHRWSIGKHRVDSWSDGMTFRVTVDEGAPSLNLSGRLLGAWPLTVGKREVIVRRVRNLDVARTELSIAGVRVPPSELAIRYRPAAAGAVCERHASLGSSAYRAGAPPPARIACGTCCMTACKGCRAVDGVRCRVCFDAAVAAMVRDERKARLMGVVIGAAVTSTLLLCGVATSSAILVKAGSAGLAGLVVLVVSGLYAERKEARLLAAASAGGATDRPDPDA